MKTKEIQKRIQKIIQKKYKKEKQILSIKKSRKLSPKNILKINVIATKREKNPKITLSQQNVKKNPKIRLSQNLPKKSSKKQINFLIHFKTDLFKTHFI